MDAEALKQRGNQCFQKGKLNAAIDMYTEAILMDASQSTYFSNRALCHSKLEQWAACRDDCVSALERDAQNLKARYLLGTSQARLEHFDEAVEALQKALNGAENMKRSKSFQHEILIELRRTKKQRWHATQKTRLAEMDAVRQRLAVLFSERNSDEWDSTMAYVESLLSQEEERCYPQEIPDHFVCPISMEIMLDPVSTPNGACYERACIEEHIKKNGPFDPLTRDKVTLHQLRPNRAIQLAIYDYLDRNPWAFEY